MCTFWGQFFYSNTDTGKELAYVLQRLSGKCKIATDIRHFSVTEDSQY